MNSLNLDDVRDYVNENIVDFHQRRLKSLKELKLEKLLTKNPYLFKAKNILTANALIEDLLSAFLSSSEEKLFGDFLEGLAVFIAQKTCGGHKSTAQGVDLEFFNNDTYYVVSIKSGPNWGNSSQATITLISLPYKCHCEAVFAEAISYFAGISAQKRDCRAAKEQERRLAMTSIYEMYGRETLIKHHLIPNSQILISLEHK